MSNILLIVRKKIIYIPHQWCQLKPENQRKRLRGFVECQVNRQIKGRQSSDLEATFHLRERLLEVPPKKTQKFASKQKSRKVTEVEEVEVKDVVVLVVAVLVIVFVHEVVVRVVVVTVLVVSVPVVDVDTDVVTFEAIFLGFDQQEL